MIKNNDRLDNAVYIISVILTLGTTWVMRVIITTAIRAAFDNVKTP